MVIVPILVFQDWTKEFHVHVDASSIALGVVLAQLGIGVVLVGRYLQMRLIIPLLKERD
jgi:hypothetical protein